MIRYEWIRENLTAVFLENKRVGKIQKDPDGFRYYPKGKSKGGDAFPTLTECKRSLEEM